MKPSEAVPPPPPISSQQVVDMPVPMPAPRGSPQNSIKIPITGVPLNQYPASVRSMGTGIGDELDYDAYSVIDRSRPGSPVQMPAFPPAPVPMPAVQAGSGSGSGFRSKMNNLFRKRPTPSQNANARGIPTSLSSSADADAYVSADNGVPYAASRRSVGSGGSGGGLQTRDGAGLMMMAGAGPEAMAKIRLFELLASFCAAFRAGARMSFILRPIDAIADTVPALEPTVVIIEMIMLMWLLYEVSILLEMVTTGVKVICRPAIVLGRMVGFGFK